MSSTKVNQYQIDWETFEKDIHILMNMIKTNEIRMRERYQSIYGILRGGLVIAVRLSHLLGVPLIRNKRLIEGDTLIVDDVADSGHTLKEFSITNSTATLYRKNKTKVEPNYCVRTINKYIVFPWEQI